MLSVLPVELGGVEELLLDGLLDWSLEPEVPEVAPPLIEELLLLEPAAGGVVLLLDELGLVVSMEEEEDELGEDGVVVADGVDEVLLLVPDLVRSQPVTAAVATASTATRGMSLFMNSPFECGCGV